ncbi:hypothetical protein A2318_02455 [Candidatus Uhrbacteria bacterium RIFOXYB2_FULL_45_11]|uniref:Uncharacterized protein n=1 Tax=Candidatus Uhrbacteria bacterium RIFOXYB2_FULL_45_11 TaxID=1802421 RepID=A0A1F7W3C8_9BACT|nr:MAG: hypothetical protein A2318_02455 [Candidatus Uhrbacteria bacterium RIFOXYB2_FULL_45_11]
MCNHVKTGKWVQFNCFHPNAGHEWMKHKTERMEKCVQTHFEKGASLFIPPHVYTQIPCLTVLNLSFVSDEQYLKHVQLVKCCLCQTYFVQRIVHVKTRGAKHTSSEISVVVAKRLADEACQTLTEKNTLFRNSHWEKIHNAFRTGVASKFVASDEHKQYGVVQSQHNFFLDQVKDFFLEGSENASGS